MTATGVGEPLLVLVIHFPPLDRTRDIEATVAQWGPELGFPVLDLRASFESTEKATGESMWGRHFSARGHQIAAQALRATLDDLGWTR